MSYRADSGMISASGVARSGGRRMCLASSRSRSDESATNASGDFGGCAIGNDCQRSDENHAAEKQIQPAGRCEAGQEAAAQVEQQLPLLRDDNVTSYVSDIGQRLVEAIPAELRHPEFSYTFKVVNVKEINAFALPGGPMYVNRGMIEAAKTEGEVAGVVAHELSHVALRHGTAQATKATPYEIGTIAGAILGAIVGGTAGSAIAQGTQFGLGAAFLRYSREYEKQADLEGVADHGARRLRSARHGEHVQDDRAAGRLRRTAVAERSPEPRQSLRLHHQGSASRCTSRTRGATAARSRACRRNCGRCRRRLRPRRRRRTRGRPPRHRRRRPTAAASARTSSAPSSRYSSYNEGNLFRISVPSNWRELPGNNSVTFAPEGGYGAVNQQSVFTHGVEAGVTRNESARSADRDRRAGAVAVAVESAYATRLAVTIAERSAAARGSRTL